MHFTTRTLTILALASGSLANLFQFPAPTSGQEFHDGDTIDVSWTTTYTKSSLQLYCSYLTNRKFCSIPIIIRIQPAIYSHC